MTATAAIDAPFPSSVDLLTLLREAVVARGPLSESRWGRWWHRMQSISSCERPVRLRGSTHLVDARGRWHRRLSSWEEADGVLLTSCGDRRASRCRGCAHTYQGDAYQVVATGLRGGKGVPATTAEHPRLFVTLTAPSFGAVHATRHSQDGRPLPCHARRDGGRCPHGRARSCTVRHAEDDPLLGRPLCLDCYDVDGQVLFNAYLPELWRRTTVYLPRMLAAHLGVSAKQLTQMVRISYVKVAEFQARGAVHLHAVLRLDAAPADGDRSAVEPPPPGIDATALEAALRATVETAYVPLPPLPGRPADERLRWGKQLDAHSISGGGQLSEDQVASYVAKYATKSTEVLAGPERPLRSERDLTVLPADMPAHVRAAVEAAWRLGTIPQLAELRLRAWAHLLGFRGHLTTKSAAYSTTFTALRRERASWAWRHATEQSELGQEMADGAAEDASDTTLVVRSWRYAGRGYTTAADATLAAHLAEQDRHHRQEDRAAIRQAQLDHVDT